MWITANIRWIHGLDKDSGISMDRPKVWDDAIDAVVKNGYAPKIVGK